MGEYSEIYLLDNYVDTTAWEKLLDTLENYNGLFNYLKIIIKLENNKIQFFVKTKNKIPPTINNLSAFLFKSCEKVILPKPKKSRLIIPKLGSNLIDITNYLEIKNKGHLKYVEIFYKRISDRKVAKKVNLYVENMGEIIKYHTLFTYPKKILSIDFKGNKRYIYQNVPKYLDMSKSLSLLDTNSSLALVKVDTFPYLQGDFYLKQNAFSFNKHSIIMGASGSGKSKLISLFVENIFKNFNLKNNYRFVIIDPHAALQNDIGAFSNIIDFNDIAIDLFKDNGNDIISQTEMMLELFKGLIADQYNAKLERVLRHSIYLLLTAHLFNFVTLKRLLIEADYRNELVNKERENIPQSIISFFLADFNDLKTKSYAEAISPIIAFIDEMQMIPVFNIEDNLLSLEDSIKSNFITLFSLDKTKLGDKNTKMIAGLIMQKLFSLMQNHTFSEHIIFIIDEVATVENSILPRFLSEMRKYNLSLFLAGQYFSQISENLQNAIFANVSNYYLFKMAKKDASIFVNNINFKILIEDTIENKINMLTELENRKCLIRVENNGKLVPAFMGKTMDFISKPASPRVIYKKEVQLKQTKQDFNFNTSTSINLKDILKSQSASRKEVK